MKTPYILVILPIAALILFNLITKARCNMYQRECKKKLKKQKTEL